MHQTQLSNIPTIEQLEGGNTFSSDPERITPDVSKFIRNSLPNSMNNMNMSNTSMSNVGSGQQRPVVVPEFFNEPKNMAFNTNYSELNCVDVSEHIKNCPVCSRLYKPDTSIHMILIILLGSLCLVLTHKIINK
jgi:hypothetical protein